MKREKISQNHISTFIQNWQVKPAFSLGLTILLALFFQSCEEPIEVTGDLVPDANRTSIKYVEIPLEMNQAAYDSSLISSNATNGSRGQVFVGHQSNPEIGDFTATGYMGLVLDGNTIRTDPQIGAQILKTNLFLNFNYFYGDEFTEIQDFSVYQLVDTVERQNTNYTIYDELEAGIEVSQESPIGVGPSDTLTAKIALENSYGSSLLSKVINEDLDATELYNAVKGIKIEVANGTNNLQGINLSSGASYVEVEYLNPGEDSSKVFKFNLSSSSFTHVDFQPGSLIPSDYSNNRNFELTDPSKVYFNNLIGVSPKINLSNYAKFIDTVDYMLINKAEIVIEGEDFEVQENTVVQKRPALQIIPYIMKEDGLFAKVGENFWAVQGSFSSTGGLANPSGALNPTSLGYDETNNVIRGDVSFFLQEIYNDPSFWDYSQQLVFTGQIITQNPDPFIPTARMNIGNFNNILVDKENVKLRIYYTTFN